jgi:hypothetical protein
MTLASLYLSLQPQILPFSLQPNFKPQGGISLTLNIAKNYLEFRTKLLGVCMCNLFNSAARLQYTST